MVLIARNKNVLWTELDGQVALLDVEGGRYYEANKLGSVIWNLLETPLTASEIVTHLLSRFRVDQQRCEVDVNEFLNTLCNIGLLERSETTVSQ
jgi:hypothetical protein